MRIRPKHRETAVASRKVTFVSKFLAILPIQSLKGFPLFNLSERVTKVSLANKGKPQTLTQVSKLPSFQFIEIQSAF